MDLSGLQDQSSSSCSSGEEEELNKSDPTSMLSDQEQLTSDLESQSQEGLQIETLSEPTSQSEEIMETKSRDGSTTTSYPTRIQEKLWNSGLSLLTKSGSAAAENPPTKSTKPEKHSFSLQCKNLYLTYPQCAVAKEDLLEMIQLYFDDNLLWAVVSSEKHQDGSPHLHSLVSLKTKFKTYSSSTLDQLADQHGNYQAARSVNDTLRYILKDGNYVAHGIDPKEYLSLKLRKKNSQMAVVAQLVREGKPLESIEEANPGFFMMHKNHVEEYQTWVQRRNQRQSLQMFQLYLPPHATKEEKTIVRWCEDNIRKQDRPLGAPHLYICGKTCMGKTTFISLLRKMLAVYDIPPDEDYYDEYYDGTYDVAVLDEFKANKKLTWMNSWLQGHPFPLKKKGSQYLKKDNLPTIIVSNYSPQEAYEHVVPMRLDTLMRRLEYVLLVSPINIK